MALFSCAKGEGITGEVVGIGLGNATFQVKDAGVTGADECVFVGNGLLEGYDAGLLLGNNSIFVGKTVGHFLLQAVGEFDIGSDGGVDGTG